MKDREPIINGQFKFEDNNKGYYELLQNDEEIGLISFPNTEFVQNSPSQLYYIALEETVCGILEYKNFNKILQDNKEKEINKEVSILSKVSFLKNWDPETLKIMVQYSKVKQFSINQNVFQEGEEADFWCIVKQGEFVLNKNLQNKKNSIRISILQINEFFGIEDIIQGCSRSYSATCISNEGEILVFCKKITNYLMGKDQIMQQSVNEIIREKKGFFSERLNLYEPQNYKENQIKFKTQEFYDDQKIIKKELEISKQALIDYFKLQISKQMKKKNNYQLSKQQSANTKKVASYMKAGETQQQQPQQQNQSLDQAIKQKRNYEEMLKAYEPKIVEQNWMQYWEQQKFFHANAQNVLKGLKKPYVMVIPPPNVTGYLHIGHGLTSAVEDCIVRRKRMQGFETLYLPGVDHAGIATHTVVEKQLMKEEGKSRHDIGRDAFVKKIWVWKEKHGNVITEQLRRVGSSLDWDRFHFTMDDQLCVAVNEAFCILSDKGLIYRSNRLVNWSCALKTAISDVEVLYEKIDEPITKNVPGHDGKYEFGVLIHFSYKVKENPSQEIIVATTRIETMLGDVAVAVHPNDKRYQHLIGKELIHPFIPDRKLIVIADGELVDMNFGTGAVKITPAHDPNDYLCGERHNLQKINIFDDNGVINENGGPYKGMKRFDCRNKILEDLQKIGQYKDKTKNPMSIGICQRSGDIVEPLLRPQWYIKCTEIAKRMCEVVENGELKIYPENEFDKNWFQFMRNPQDWCISRQLWWGHRIPAYLYKKKGSSHTPDSSQQENWIVCRTYEEALTKAAEKLGVAKDQVELIQDEDVLDTWFSSALFPFSTMGWPNNDHEDFKAFYPNSILETGWDILFFWVARMVMMGLILLDKLPFKEVFLHPMIRDSQGEKMSKSKGNVIDPLEIIDGCPLDKLLNKILEGNLDKKEQNRAVQLKKKEYPEGFPECGSDALRFGLLAYMQQARNINLDIKRVIGYREFCNKIWQSVKFGLMYIPRDFQYQRENLQNELKNLSFLNQWILNRFNQATKNVNLAFDQYNFGDATIAFQNFWKYELCDIYLEAVKPILSSKKDANLTQQTTFVLFYVLESGLRLLHPMMPFLSEELYQKFPSFNNKLDSICINQYPEYSPSLDFPNTDNQFNYINNIGKVVRQLVNNLNLPKSAQPASYIVVLNNNEELKSIVKNEELLICTLSRINSITLITNESQAPKGCVPSAVGAFAVVYVNVKEYIDVKQEISRQQSKLAQTEKMLEAQMKKVNIPDYETKVPENIKAENKEKITTLNNEIKLLQETIEVLKTF